ncbi:MAG: mechanosensitive ion channel [Pirellulaceae bacterium]
MASHLEQCQWLIAAMTVGLDFQLFGKSLPFLCGLIILTRRPVRSQRHGGGETTGKVTRMQMRATTITDFDRRELVVPNKFITEDVINWTFVRSDYASGLAH